MNREKKLALQSTVVRPWAMVLLLLSCGTLLISVVAYPPTWFFSSLRFNPPSEQVAAALIGAVVGGLSGAAATTTGIVLTDILRERRNRDHDRRVKHYNALIILQRRVNVIRGSLEDNVDIIRTITKANDIGLPTLRRPIQIQTDEMESEGLYDLTLINMLNALYYDIRRLNSDAGNLTGVLDILAEQFLSGKITNEQYKTEVSAFRPQVVQFRQFMQHRLDHDVLDIASYLRICADRDASSEMKKRFKRLHKNREPVTTKDVRKMKKIILKELEGQAAESQKEKAEMAKYT